MSAALVRRLDERLRGTPDAVAADVLADTVFLERKRLEASRDEPPEYEQTLDAAARAIAVGSRAAVDASLRSLTDRYAREIHNPFSPQTYHVATRVLPLLLTRLLSASRARDLVLGDTDPSARIRLSGPLDQIRALAKDRTLILAPTHVSNLDSPLIGYALYAAGLPPFAYGAGLNLFSNPAMAWFMRRLGAYTVDRRKRNRLYKEVLKDYSVELLRRRCHSLFFPGGTRSRSGRLERRLKKGLLGTGLQAWQESLEEGRADGDVFVVPCTLSVGLVLEAETLIADSLAEEGKQRFIINDDEFSEPRTVLTFLRQLLRLDAAVHVRFGAPMDVAGNVVDDAGRSLDPAGRPVDRLGYVREAGRVVRDAQRDQVYTERVAERLADAYARDFVVQSTHLACWAAWRALRAARPGLDTWRLLRLRAGERAVARSAVVEAIGRARAALGAQPTALPATDDAALDEALARFASFHRVRAVAAAADGRISLDPQLALYYANRLDGYALP